jgi:hypothetical protein
MIEVGSKSDEALSRETVADLLEEVGEAPPGMQDYDRRPILPYSRKVTVEHF